MRGVLVIGALLAVGYGLGKAGVAGAASGLVGVVGVGSGLVIARGGVETGVAAFGPLRSAQRWGGLAAAMGVGLGVFHGGWSQGWLWGSLGYVAGMAAAGFLLRIFQGATREVSERAGESHAVTELPAEFDLNRSEHVLILDRIRTTYADLLANESDPYNRCLYRPSSSLPYPKPVIRKALQTLVDVAEGRRSSPYIDFGGDSASAAKTIRSTIVLLDDFIDVPRKQLPTDPTANAKVGVKHKRHDEEPPMFVDWKT